MDEEVFDSLPLEERAKIDNICLADRKAKWEAKRREEEERKRMEEDHFDQLQNDPKGKKKKGKGENEPSGRKSGEKTGQQWSSIRSTINGELDSPVLYIQ